MHIPWLLYIVTQILRTLHCYKILILISRTFAIHFSFPNELYWSLHFLGANSHLGIVTKIIELFSIMVVGINQTYNSHYTSPQTMTGMEVPIRITEVMCKFYYQRFYHIDFCKLKATWVIFPFNNFALCKFLYNWFCIVFNINMY